MTELELQQQFDLDPQVARAVAAALAQVANRPRPVPPAERQRRIGQLPNIAGTLRIEGLTLTEADRRFHTYVHNMGLGDADADAVILAYALATRSHPVRAPEPAE